MTEFTSGGGVSEVHEGEQYLRLLGLEHLAENTIAADGRTLRARDFLEVCGDHARPVLVGLEAMDPNDPRYEATRSALRGLVAQFIAPPESS